MLCCCPALGAIRRCSFGRCAARPAYRPVEAAERRDYTIGGRLGKRPAAADECIPFLFGWHAHICVGMFGA